MVSALIFRLIYDLHEWKSIIIWKHIRKSIYVCCYIKYILISKSNIEDKQDHNKMEQFVDIGIVQYMLHKRLI